MNWLIKNFLRGLVIVVPIAFTIYVVNEAFVSIDRLLPYPTMPGVGFAILIALIILIGALASNFIVHRILRLTDAIFTRAPLVRLIYASVKDLLEAFVGDEKRFDKPVAVAINEHVRTLGFMTQSDLAFLSMPGHVAVYMLYSYSMSGCVVIVPASRVTPIAADSASVMALIVSGGVSRG